MRLANKEMIWTPSRNTLGWQRLSGMRDCWLTGSDFSINLRTNMFWQCLSHCLYTGHSSWGVKTKVLLFTHPLPQSLSRPTQASLPKLFSDTPEAILTHQQENWKLTLFQLNNAPSSKTWLVCCREAITNGGSKKSQNPLYDGFAQKSTRYQILHLDTSKQQLQ